MTCQKTYLFSRLPIPFKETNSHINQHSQIVRGLPIGSENGSSFLELISITIHNPQAHDKLDPNIAKVKGYPGGDNYTLK